MAEDVEEEEVMEGVEDINYNYFKLSFYFFFEFDYVLGRFSNFIYHKD